MKKNLLVGITIFFTTSLFAQLPNSDVWLFNYAVNGGKYIFQEGMNISNHAGYDNQPSFSDNGSYMLWTSQRDSNETDIFRYAIATHTTLRITQTPFSEYSPTYVPGNKYISAVVVEKDSVQRLWRYNKTSGAAKVILPKTFGVGYHCWFDEHTLFLFQVTEPSTLVMMDARTGVGKIVTSNVGRCMQIYKSPKRKLMLYTVADSGFVWIKAADGFGNKVADFKSIRGIKDSEDFVVDHFGNIFMAQGTLLYTRKIETDSDWTLVNDFASQGLHNITRMSISPDGQHFALVDTIK
jgi:hypothetical protein